VIPLLCIQESTLLSLSLSCGLLEILEALAFATSIAASLLFELFWTTTAVDDVVDIDDGMTQPITVRS
jgi:hypothetical protein